MDDMSLWNASWSTLGKRLTEATQIAPDTNYGDHSQTGSAFAVMQANIHVTYCIARLLLVCVAPTRPGVQLLIVADSAVMK